MKRILPFTMRNFSLGLALATAGIIIGWLSPELSLFIRTQAVPVLSSGEEIIDLSWTPGDDVEPGSYTVTVTAEDNLGARSTKDISVRVLPPTSIEDISIVTHETDAVITWNTVNATVSGSIEYGLVDTLSRSVEKPSQQATLAHSVILENLIPCSTYYMRAKGELTDGTVTDQIRRFETKGCAGGAEITSQRSTFIRSSAGGSVALDSDITITVPTSFASDDATFQIHQLERDSALAVISKPSGREPVSGLYDLKALADTDDTITSFNEPLSITIGYTPAGNTNTSTLAIYRWDGSSWTSLSGCSVNTGASTVTCTTTAFSTFGVFGEGSSTSDSGGSSGGGGGGGGGGGDDSSSEATSTGRTFTYEAEKGHSISGSYSGIEANKRSAVVAHPKAKLAKKIVVPTGNYYLDVQVKDDKPGPVLMAIYVNNRAWKVVRIDKNDNKYRTHRVGILRNFKGATIDFRPINDAFDRNNPTNADKDRNLHVDWWRLVEIK